MQYVQRDTVTTLCIVCLYDASQYPETISALITSLIYENSQMIHLLFSLSIEPLLFRFFILPVVGKISA